MARPIVLIPHLFRLADVINFRKDYSPPSSPPSRPFNREAPWPLDPLESSFHDHGMSELKPGTIELNLRNETVPMDRSHQKRNFPQQGSFAQISSTRQPKRNWRLEINPLTRALPFRHHTCKEVTTIGSVRGKPAAWSVLTWPACSIWGSG